MRFIADKRSALARMRRDAYSLTELLIVMVIMLLIMAAALPVAKRVLDENRVREASRQLNAYISMAKTQATVTGRPCGVYLELTPPLGTDENPINMGPYTAANPAVYIRQSTRMFLAETPPPYAGSTTGAKGRIMQSTVTPGVFEFNPIWFDSSVPGYVAEPVERTYLAQLIAENEQFIVRFDYKGPWYSCRRGSALNPSYPDPNVLYYTGSTLTGSATPFPPGISLTNIPGYAYQILRSPQRIGQPLELTGGACVDLTYSGMGTSGNECSFANGSIALMFSPSGGVVGLYSGNLGGPAAPTGTFHFLIGRTSKMPLADPFAGATPSVYDPSLSNVADPTSLWVSVGRTSGNVTTAENVPPQVAAASLGVYLQQARSIATGREQTGGR